MGGGGLMDPIATFFLSLQPDDVALGALVTLMVISILRGWVVPRSVLRDRMADKETQITSLSEERTTWREAFQTADASRNELETQNAKLIDAGEANLRLIETLRRKLEVSL